MLYIVTETTFAIKDFRGKLFAIVIVIETNENTEKRGVNLNFLGKLLRHLRGKIIALN